MAQQELSKLEIELLTLLATTETMVSSTKIMGVSEHTLTLLLTSARRKLGAETTFQAIAKSVYEGVIEYH